MIDHRLNNSPYFIIIGAQRAGTTSLHHYLAQHPSIMSARTKEIHFFDRHFERGPGWYINQFPRTACGTRVFEASPNYLLSPWAPQRMRCFYPNVKIIVLLRNPIDRAYSHYQAKKQLAIEDADTFEEALRVETQRLKVDIARILVEQNFYSNNIRQYSYYMRGCYWSQLERWLRCFRRKQIHVVLSEQMFFETDVVLKGIYDFLKVDCCLPKDLSPKGVGQLTFGKYPEIKKSTRLLLQEKWSCEVSELCNNFGNKFCWF